MNYKNNGGIKVKKIINLMLVISTVFVLLITLTGCTKDSKDNGKYTIASADYRTFIRNCR